MATKLNKPVSRELEDWGGTTSREAKRAMVITLSPAGFISFRSKGMRQEYDLDIASAYSLAVKRYASKMHEQGVREKEIKKQGLS
jgi:hypothetical protein